MMSLLLAVIYLSFISLGLPDSLLGAGWPTMYPDFEVPVSCMGLVSMIISCGTILSSLWSDRLNRRLGTGLVTALSVAATAAAILGFSWSRSFWVLCLWAIPYGLGAGSVDASLNNYVAMHFSSRHMNWLHCMWGVGASVSPYIMGFVLTGGRKWFMGYRIVGIMQVIMAALLVASLPLWKRSRNRKELQQEAGEPLGLLQTLRIPGAPEAMMVCLSYCALETTAGLWASSYLVLYRGVAPDTAAFFASLFYTGITVGRGISGFISMRFQDRQMINMGLTVLAAGLGAMFIPTGSVPALAGLLLIGLGCAPIYPAVLHSTPDNFGAKYSQSIMGIQIATAYVGVCIAPMIFGILANHIHVALLPLYLLLILVLMVWMVVRCRRQCRLGHCSAPAETGSLSGGNI